MNRWVNLVQMLVQVIPAILNLFRKKDNQIPPSDSKLP